MAEYCPGCGRNLALVGRVHHCGMPAQPEAVIIRASVSENTGLLDSEPSLGHETTAATMREEPKSSKGFDKRLYQREYMRKRRAEKRAAKA